MKRPTQRIYTNIETNQRFVMYYNDINDTRDLRNEITG
jgi:ribosomal protein S17E